jgi:hypothetical protein
MDTNLTEQQSIRIIQEMIATSKNNLKDNSFFYLLWGWLVLSASLTHFILIQVHWEYAFLPWPVLMMTGGIISVVAGYRLGKKARVVSHVDKMIIYLWYAFMAVVLIIIAMALMDKILWVTTYPVIISLYGLGTFVSGGVLRFRPLIIGGIACWVISVIAFFVPSSYVLLLTGLSVIIAYLIPGYLLKSKEE